MTETTFWSSKAIHAASEDLQKIRPAYTEMLNFYRQIFALQEDYRRSAVVKPIDISAELLTAKCQASLPLASSAEFPIDQGNARRLLIEICDLAQQTKASLQGAAKRIADALATESISVQSAWANFDNEQEMVNLSDRLGVPPTVLTTLLYHAARPSILVTAEQLQTYLNGTDQWNKGYCPICGHAPILALLDDDNGKRALHCSFCWHAWSLPRLFCPFCETTDAELLRYFFSEKEQEYRVDLCDNCNKYIKTVDTRKTSRRIYPALEAVATAHLDMKAQGLGHTVGGETML